MCFTIDGKAKAPKKKTMWKVVELCPDGSVASMIKGNHKWQTGLNKAKGKIERRGRNISKGGIYVYNSKRRAVDCAKRYSPWKTSCVGVPMKVHVDPEDWLASSTSKGQTLVHTYWKVTVPENQPYMVWY